MIPIAGMRQSPAHSKASKDYKEFEKDKSKGSFSQRKKSSTSKRTIKVVSKTSGVEQRFESYNQDGIDLAKPLKHAKTVSLKIKHLP